MFELTREDREDLAEYALHYGAIATIVEQRINLINQIKPLPDPQDESQRDLLQQLERYRAKTDGNNKAALTSELFTRYIRSLAEHETAEKYDKSIWAIYLLLNKIVVKLVRNHPNLATGRATSFDSGVNILQPVLFDGTFGGASTENLYTETDPINVYFEIIPDSTGIKSCRFYSTIQDSIYSFNEHLDVSEIYELAQQIQEVSPAWMDLLDIEHPLPQTVASSTTTTETDSALGFDKDQRPRESDVKTSFTQEQAAVWEAQQKQAQQEDQA